MELYIVFLNKVLGFSNIYYALGIDLIDVNLVSF